MSNNYDKIITTVNSVTEDYSFLPNQNECIVIDTSNNRIGINNLNPEHSLDISYGTIKAHDLKIEGNAEINNFNTLRLDNKTFASKLDNNDQIIIESSGNTIKFKGDVIFEKLITFNTLSYEGATISLEYYHNDVIIGGGHITDCSIGETSGGSINRCFVGYFNNMDTLYLYANLIDVSNIYIYNNATIDNSLSVANIEISENLFVNNIADISALLVYNDISCNSNFYLLNDLNVYQNTYISGNTIIDKNTTIYGNTNISGQFHVDNSSNLNGDVNINGNLEVSNGSVKIDEGYYFIGNGSKLTQVGAWALEQYYDASFQNVDICHNLTICNELIVYNTAIFKQDLSINGVINCDGSIYIDGNAYFSTQIDTDELYVRGKVIFTETADISINTENFRVLQIDISENLNSYNATINNKLDASSLEISNNAIIKNTLSVNSIEISNDVTINNKLDVSSIEISNNLLVNDSIFVDNNVIINNKLDASSIEISNNAIIHQHLIVNSIEISDNATINNVLDVSFIEISNNAIIKNTLYVNYIEISNNATINNKLDASSIEISNNLLVNNSIFVDNNVTINNKLDANSIEISNNAIIHNNLTVNQDASFNNLVEISGLLIHNDLSVNNNIISNIIYTDDLSVNNNAYFQQKITAQNVDICTNLIADNTTLNTLQVNNTSNFVGDVSFNSNIYIDKNITLNGNLNQNNLFYFKIKGINDNQYYNSDQLYNISNNFKSEVFKSNNLQNVNILTDIQTNNGYKVPISGIYNVNSNITWKIDNDINNLNDINNSILYIIVKNNTSGEDIRNTLPPLYLETSSDSFIYITQSINENMRLEFNNILSVHAEIKMNNNKNEVFYIDYNKSTWSLTLINPL